MCRTKRVMRYDWVRTCVCKCECVYNCVWVENNVHVVYLWIWEHIFWPRNTSQMSHCSLMFYTARLLFFFFQYSYLPNTPSIHTQSKYLSSKGLLAKQCHGRVLFVCIILWHRNVRSCHKRSQKLYSVSGLPVT